MGCLRRCLAIFLVFTLTSQSTLFHAESLFPKPTSNRVLASTFRTEALAAPAIAAPGYTLGSHRSAYIQHTATLLILTLMGAALLAPRVAWAQSNGSMSTSDLGIGSLVGVGVLMLVLLGIMALALQPDKEKTPAPILIGLNAFRYILGMFYLQLAYRISCAPSVPLFENSSAWYLQHSSQIMKGLVDICFGGMTLFFFLNIWHSLRIQKDIRAEYRFGWASLMIMGIIASISELFQNIKVFIPNWYLHEFLHEGWTPDRMDLPAWAQRLIDHPILNTILWWIYTPLHHFSVLVDRTVFIPLVGSLYRFDAFAIFPDIMDLVWMCAAFLGGWRARDLWTGPRDPPLRRWVGKTLRAALFIIAGAYAAFHLGYFLHEVFGLSAITQRSESDYAFFRAVWGNLPIGWARLTDGLVTMSAAWLVFSLGRSLIRLILYRRVVAPAKTRHWEQESVGVAMALLTIAFALSAPARLALDQSRIPPSQRQSYLRNHVLPMLSFKDLTEAYDRTQRNDLIDIPPDPDVPFALIEYQVMTQGLSAAERARLLRSVLEIQLITTLRQLRRDVLEDECRQFTLGLMRRQMQQLLSDDGLAQFREDPHYKWLRYRIALSILSETPEGRKAIHQWARRWALDLSAGRHHKVSPQEIEARLRSLSEHVFIDPERHSFSAVPHLKVAA